jgi:hypothetical protein
MSSVVSRAAISAFLIAAIGASAANLQTGVTASLHPWGRFEPGAWKLVHVVTEMLNEQGHVAGTNAADTKTILTDVDGEGVALEVQTCMEVAGKRFQNEPQTVKQGFHGEPAALKFTSKDPVDGQVVVEGRSIACKVHALEWTDAQAKTTVQIYYSSTVAPYVLRRESVTTDPDGKTVLSETTVEVVALDMPVRVHEATRNGCFLKTVQKNAKGTIVTLATVLADVPGGVIRHSSKELDKSGRLIRRSTLELVDYGANSDDDRSGLFRKRPNRRGKSPPR